MKKTFKLSPPETKAARHLEAIKSEVRKYIKRERKKKLPDGVDFWDFDCKMGPSVDEAKKIHLTEIAKCIDEANTKQQDSFYLEILAKPGHRMKKPKPEDNSSWEEE